MPTNNVRPHPCGQRGMAPVGEGGGAHGRWTPSWVAASAIALAVVLAIVLPFTRGAYTESIRRPVLSLLGTRGDLGPSPRDAVDGSTHDPDTLGPPMPARKPRPATRGPSRERLVPRPINSTVPCKARLPAADLPRKSNEMRAILQTPPCKCTIVAFHHIRKCAGMAFREAFNAHMKAFGYRPPIFKCFTLGTYFKRFQGARRGARHEFQNWEVHCDNTLVTFFRMLEPYARGPLLASGCQVFSFTLLRHPIRWMESDFHYFVNEIDHVNVTFLEYGQHHPEAMLFQGTPANLGFNVPAPGEINATLPDRTLAAYDRLRRVRHDFLDFKLRSRAREARERKGLLVDRLRGVFAEQRIFNEERLVARAAYIQELKRLGHLRCEDLVPRAHEHLAKFDLVGIAEHLDATLLLIADEIGLQAVPPMGQINHNPHRKRLPSSAVYKEFEELNECSIQVYEHWKEQFSYLLASKDEHFHERLRLLKEVFASMPSPPVRKYATTNATPKQIAEGIPLAGPMPDASPRSLGPASPRVPEPPHLPETKGS